MTTPSDIRRAIAMLTQGGKATELAPATPRSTAERGDRKSESLRRLVPKSMCAVADKVQSTHQSWVKHKNFQGVGMAPNFEGGCRQDELVLRVYVEKKRSKRECKAQGIFVKPSLWVKGMPEKVPTDVVAIGKLKLQMNTARVRPARPGVSLFHFSENEAGTFGCLVVKAGTTTPRYILSNAHVLAQESTANQDAPIIQPGKLDGGASPGDVIATLSESVEFEFGSSSLQNVADAAIAKVTGSVTSVIDRIGAPPAGFSRAVRRDMSVKKVGRTTGLTTGIIEDIDFTTKPLRYRKPSGKTGLIQFHHQVACTVFTAPGDSGAVVLNDRNKIVGLHFAGSESISVFNRIGFVLNTLGIRPVTTVI